MGTAAVGAMLAVGILLVGVTRRAQAQKGDRPAPRFGEREGPSTRVYDVSDLLADVADHPNDTTVVPPTRLPEPDDSDSIWDPDEDLDLTAKVGKGRAEKACMDPQHPPLVELIRDHIAPMSWRPVGEDGYVNQTNRFLVVTQTAQNHRAIEKLLADLRGARTALPRVTVTAHWLLMKPKQPARWAAELVDSVPPEVDLAGLTKDGAELAAHLRLSCFSGQQVHATCGKAQSVLIRSTAVVGENCAAMEPGVAVVQWGGVLEVRPSVRPTLDSVDLDLSSVFSLPHEMGTIPVEGGGPGEDENQPPGHSIDRLNFSIHTIRSTLRVPVGKPVLVGSAALQKPGAEGLLLLVMRVDVAK